MQSDKKSILDADLGPVLVDLLVLKLDMSAYFSITFIFLLYTRLLGNRITTSIIGVEGKDANHFTTTMAQIYMFAIEELI